MKYKLIVFDLDGTVVTPDYQVLPGTLDAIDELRDLGLRITIATGRSYSSMEKYADLLQIEEPMVFQNGAVYDDPETMEREIAGTVPLETALIVLMLRSEFNLSIKAVMSDGTIYKTDNTPWLGEDSEFQNWTVDENLTANLEEDPTKLMFFGEREQMQAMQKRLDEILGAKSGVRMFSSHEKYMEMTSRSVSKGSALLKILKKLDISPQEVIAVGDNENDFEMLRNVGLGVVSGEGNKSLNSVSKFQIPSPENGGIEKLRDWLIPQLVE